VVEDNVFVGSDTQSVAPVLNEKTQIAKTGYVRPVKQKR
jgi:bifunctional N-acetylglucosamine-1-phosphate-uridyltransferase/glucosamine-1-phosphate-acetyltransferase GlmU-like protein